MKSIGNMSELTLVADLFMCSRMGWEVRRAYPEVNCRQ
jgi:hypothetical protein